MKEDKITNNFAKLKWACRRGMLELDVLLNNFLEEAYPSLTQSEQDLFVALLNCQDPEIFAWLMESSVPDDPGLLKITTLIRQHARSRI